MAVPVVYSLARQYPELRVTVLSRAYARPLFEGLAPNIGFMEADLKHEYRGISGLNALYRRLAAKQFTAVADLHNVLRSDFLRMRFNIGHFRVEHIHKHRRGRRRLTSVKHKKLSQQPSSFQNYTEVFERLGYPINIQFHSIFGDGKGDLSLLPADVVSQLDGASQLIGIAPFAAHKGKVYPPEKMKQVISQLVARHPQARILLFGRGHDEEQYFTQWRQEFPQCLYVSNHIDNLRDELVLMSRLNVMLSMDSANMQLASLTGIPVVSIWGATHPYAGFLGLPCRPPSTAVRAASLARSRACVATMPA